MHKMKVDRTIAVTSLLTLALLAAPKVACAEGITEDVRAEAVVVAEQMVAQDEDAGQAAYDAADEGAAVASAKATSEQEESEGAEAKPANARLPRTDGSVSNGAAGESRTPASERHEAKAASVASEALAKADDASNPGIFINALMVIMLSMVAMLYVRHQD